LMRSDRWEGESRVNAREAPWTARRSVSPLGLPQLVHPRKNKPLQFLRPHLIKPDLAHSRRPGRGACNQLVEHHGYCLLLQAVPRSEIKEITLPEMQISAINLHRHLVIQSVPLGAQQIVS